MAWMSFRVTCSACGKEFRYDPYPGKLTRHIKKCDDCKLATRNAYRRRTYVPTGNRPGRPSRTPEQLVAYKARRAAAARAKWAATIK